MSSLHKVSKSGPPAPPVETVDILPPDGLDARTIALIVIAVA